MWNRISGKSTSNNDDQASTRHRSGSTESKKKASSQRSDARDRGFNPTSTSFSSSSRAPYKGVAGPSVASSYATASGNNNDDGPYQPPGLIRNASLADKMPKSKTERDEPDRGKDGTRKRERRRERSTSRDGNKDLKERSGDPDQDEKRERREKRERKEKRRKERRGGEETSRGPADFSSQIGSAGFAQFPGQYDGAIPGPVERPPDHTEMSSHVQDQFPGQFPTDSSAPYRPPLASSEGGPGLAAEYYGDAGESVLEQPGHRLQSPNLIVNADPHLQPASSVEAPPTEPSALGGVGAAASFYSGSFDESTTVSSQGASASYVSAPSRPENAHDSSASTMPTLGSGAIGAATGYMLNGQSSRPPRPDDASTSNYSQSEILSSTNQRPPSQAQDTYYSQSSRPSRPGKASSQSSSIPFVTGAAGAAGAAGLAAVAYHNSHQSSQHASVPQGYPSTPLQHRHRKAGPLGALVDFFRDPEGVAQFEEYSEIIGVCRGCFEPGSSLRDAPRKHRGYRRRSNERYGSSARVDKDNRYYSSENENRRKKDKSWLATGLAGYGLAKVGESLFNQKNDFDDTYSVKSGRTSPKRIQATRRSSEIKTRRRTGSNERIVTGIASDGRVYKPEGKDAMIGGSTTTKRTARRHSRSRSRSRSRDRKSSIAGAALGAAVGSSVASSSTRRRSRSPKGAFVRSKNKSQNHSPERRRKSHKKKGRGFFGFGYATSSSSSLDLSHGSRKKKHRSSKIPKSQEQDDREAKAALLGLGAAAAALAAKDSRQSHKTKGFKDLVAVKETDNKSRRQTDHGRNRKSSASSVEEGWVSASQDEFSSVDSQLAFGDPGRRGSRESLSSQSSGTDKWGWRWGSKRKRKEAGPRRMPSNDSNLPGVAGAAGAAMVGAAVMSPDQYQAPRVDSTSSLQHVYPVPTSDPGRFDVQRDEPALSSRPEVVPIQHPQPITPVSSKIYSTQPPETHSYSAPSGPPVFSQPSYPPLSNEYRITPNVPGSFSRYDEGPDELARDFKLKRRGTSPARFGDDAVSSSMAPRRRPSAKDDSSAVRFNLTEEQEEKDRRERRGKRRDDEERTDKESRSSKGRMTESSTVGSIREEIPEKNSNHSWAVPVATGIAGAAIGAATIAGKSKDDETREERRERRRKEREREDEEEEDSKARRDRRRRRERVREGEESTSKDEYRQKCRELEQDVAAGKERERLENIREPQAETSVRHEAAAVVKPVHEDYQTFFTPIELRNSRANDQAKVTSRNPNADIDLERNPEIITIEPRRSRDMFMPPTFSEADTDDKIDLSKLSYPWQVPRLRLLEPTPPPSRCSTPVIAPRYASKEEEEEELSKPDSSPNVTWADAQMNQDASETLENDHEIPIEPAQEEHSREILAQKHSDSDSDDDKRRERKSRRQHDVESDPGPSKPTASYANDVEFAATLAASAEDAGFDPNIVIDNPAYRRRDSPPVANERIMPGSFEDDDFTTSNPKEKKKKSKSAKRQSRSEDINERNDDAIVQDIIGQVEQSEPQNGTEDFLVDPTDKWHESARKISKKAKKSKKGRGDTQPSEKVSTLESREKDDVPLDRELPDTYSKDSNRDISDVGDKVSSVSSAPSMDSATGSKSKSKEGSAWARILGSTRDNLQDTTSAKVKTKEASMESFEEPKKSKKSKSHRTTSEPNGDDKEQDKGTNAQRLPAKVYPPVATPGRGLLKDVLIIEKDHSSSLGRQIPPAGSVTQFLDDENELEHGEKHESESFLGTRPEPPPPPDIGVEGGEPPGTSGEGEVFEAHVLESSTNSVNHRRRPSEISTTDSPESPKSVASPTAVPVHFRRPGPASASRRSMSQTPFSSAQDPFDMPQRQRPRPRSTEFKLSREFRPLWLVERHKSHQEPPPEEVYPSLPSSHSNSASSSVHDPEEHDRNQNDDQGTVEEVHEPPEGLHGFVIGSSRKPMQSDLLDSQQATPTAASFGHRPAIDLSSQTPDRSIHPDTGIVEEDHHNALSHAAEAAMRAAIGGSAASALSKLSHDDTISARDIPREEAEQFEAGLKDMDPGVAPSQATDDPTALEEDGNSRPSRTKKRKKSKRRSENAQQYEGISMPPSRGIERSASEVEVEAVHLAAAQPLKMEEARRDSEARSKASLLSQVKGQDDIASERLYENGNSTERIQHLRREYQIDLESSGAKRLTKDTPQGEVVSMMSAAALLSEETAKHEPPSAGFRPDEGLSERDVAKVQGDLRDNKQTAKQRGTPEEQPSGANKLHFVDPFTERTQELIRNTSVKDEVSGMHDGGMHMSLQDRDISPRAIPLPIEDAATSGFDDVHEEAQVVPSIDGGELITSSAVASDGTHTRQLSATSEVPIDELEKVAVEPEQGNEDDMSVPISKFGKKAKMSEKNFRDKIAGPTPSQLENLVTSAEEPLIVADKQARALVDEPQVVTPHDEAKEGEDEGKIFDVKKKSKKGKKQKSKGKSQEADEKLAVDLDNDREVTEDQSQQDPPNLNKELSPDETTEPGHPEIIEGANAPDDELHDFADKRDFLHLQEVKETTAEPIGESTLDWAPPKKKKKGKSAKKGETFSLDDVEDPSFVESSKSAQNDFTLRPTATAKIVLDELPTETAQTSEVTGKDGAGLTNNYNDIAMPEEGTIEDLQSKDQPDIFEPSLTNLHPATVTELANATPDQFIAPSEVVIPEAPTTSKEDISPATLDDEIPTRSKSKKDKRKKAKKDKGTDWDEDEPVLPDGKNLPSGEVASPAAQAEDEVVVQPNKDPTAGDGFDDTEPLQVEIPTPPKSKKDKKKSKKAKASLWKEDNVAIPEEKLGAQEIPSHATRDEIPIVPDEVSVPGDALNGAPLVQNDNLAPPKTKKGKKKSKKTRDSAWDEEGIAMPEEEGSMLEAPTVSQDSGVPENISQENKDFESRDKERTPILDSEEIANTLPETVHKHHDGGNDTAISEPSYGFEQPSFSEQQRWSTVNDDEGRSVRTHDALDAVSCVPSSIREPTETPTRHDDSQPHSAPEVESNVDAAGDPNAISTYRPTKSKKGKKKGGKAKNFEAGTESAMDQKAEINETVEHPASEARAIDGSAVGNRSVSEPVFSRSVDPQDLSTHHTLPEEIVPTEDSADRREGISQEEAPVAESTAPTAEHKGERHAIPNHSKLSDKQTVHTRDAETGPRMTVMDTSKTPETNLGIFAKYEDNSWNEPVTKGKKSKKAKKNVQIATNEPGVIGDSFGEYQAPELKPFLPDTEQIRSPVVPGEAPVDSPLLTATVAQGEDDTWGEPVKKSRKNKNGKNNVQNDTDEPQVIEDPLESLQTSEPRPLVPEGERIASPDIPEEALIDTPLSAVSIEMLNLEEQREYNEEYARELERQLSPLRAEMGNTLDSDQSHDPASPPPSIDALIEHPPLDEPRETLARATSLDDIIEESRSRLGSLHYGLASQDDGLAPFKSTKKAKKGKKGKKQQQPVVWEDETATQEDERETNFNFDGPVDSPRPIDLEEPIGDRGADDEDWRSLARGSPSLGREPSLSKDDAADYFGIHPVHRAEDVSYHGISDHQQALATEPSSLTREEAVKQRYRELNDHGVDTFIHQDSIEDVGTHEASSGDKEIVTPSAPIDQPAEYEWDPVPRKNSMGKESKKDKSAREASPLGPDMQDITDFPPHAQASNYDRTIGAPSASKPHSTEDPTEVEQRALSSFDDGRGKNEGVLATEGFAAVAGLSAGAVAVEELSRKDSKKKGKKNQKRKGSTKEPEEEREESLERAAVLGKDHKQPTSGLESSMREPESVSDTPHISPMRSNVDENAPEGETQDSSSHHQDQYRDSAIHFSDSPILPGQFPVHRVARDSGYPETEGSPIISQDTGLRQLSIEPETIEPYRTKPVHESGSTHQGYEGKRDQIPTKEGAINIHVSSPVNTEPEYTTTRLRGEPSEPDVDGSYGADRDHESYWPDRSHDHERVHGRTNEKGLNIITREESGPEDTAAGKRSRQRRSRRASGGDYDSDDSADSGFDIQRRRRMQAREEEQRQPSPVSSTTKDRSSVLFDSSPSAREELLDRQCKDHGRSLSPSERALAHNRNPSPQPPAAEEGFSGADPALYPQGEEDQGIRRSLFGGPIHEDDVMSNSRSPASNDSRGRRRLRTISEDSGEVSPRSPLHKRDKRADSDIGSPESGGKAQRTWRQNVDSGEERGSSRHSQASAMGSIAAHERERRDNRGGMKSPDSIHAIIRTPDQVRSASGQSYRSSGTPPLRRVDRSLSGDLRAASKKIEAKAPRAKIAEEAEPSEAEEDQEDQEIDDRDINIPSSSTYDPVTDKGKNRAEMPDYVRSHPRMSL